MKFSQPTWDGMHLNEPFHGLGKLGLRRITFFKAKCLNPTLLRNIQGPLCSNYKYAYLLDLYIETQWYDQCPEVGF